MSLIESFRALFRPEPQPEPQPDLPIRFVGDLHRLQVLPGDVLVVQTDQILTGKAREHLRAILVEHIPGHRVLVLDRSLSLGAVAPAVPPASSWGA